MFKTESLFSDMFQIFPLYLVLNIVDLQRNVNLSP